ncbi:hypothetical protein [Roseococcus microcysteis]|uniref:hypothetical protein n=1 Tax=Roseococcus microcysteis TaxID=2771361 RepID=UPI00168B9DC9|nr:hypothetical protein [Roseococcus microcysteis]
MASGEHKIDEINKIVEFDLSPIEKSRLLLNRRRRILKITLLFTALYAAIMSISVLYITYLENDLASLTITVLNKEYNLLSALIWYTIMISALLFSIVSYFSAQFAFHNLEYSQVLRHTLTSMKSNLNDVRSSTLIIESIIQESKVLAQRNVELLRRNHELENEISELKQKYKFGNEA